MSEYSKGFMFKEKIFRSEQLTPHHTFTESIFLYSVIFLQRVLGHASLYHFMTFNTPLEAHFPLPVVYANAVGLLQLRCHFSVTTCDSVTQTAITRLCL